MAVERQGQCLNLNISLAGRQSELWLSIFLLNCSWNSGIIMLGQQKSI